MKAFIVIFITILASFLGFSYLQNRSLKIQPEPTANLTVVISPSSIPLSGTADWKTYTSPFRFSVKYPATWYADTENSKLVNFMSLTFEEFKKIDLKQNQDKYASMTIYVFESSETLEERAAKRETESTLTETTVNGLRALKIKKKPSFTNGIYYEYLLKDKTGRLTVSVNTETISPQLQPLLDQILFTFKFLGQKISAEKAVELVRNQKEVKDWLALFSGAGETSPKTGGRAVINFDHMSGNKYIIHVYEELSDHTATFNWYEVDSETGTITRTF